MKRCSWKNNEIVFFKQKTAYEILTCDWSSDVCSSDLKESSVASKDSAREASSSAADNSPRIRASPTVSDPAASDWDSGPKKK